MTKDEELSVLKSIDDKLNRNGNGRHRANEWLTWIVRMIVPAILTYGVYELGNIRKDSNDFKYEVTRSLSTIRANQTRFVDDIEDLKDGQKNLYTESDARRDLGILNREVTDHESRIRSLESIRRSNFSSGR